TTTEITLACDWNERRCTGPCACARSTGSVCISAFAFSVLRRLEATGTLVIFWPGYTGRGTVPRVALQNDLFLKYQQAVWQAVALCGCVVSVESRRKGRTG